MPTLQRPTGTDLIASGNASDKVLEPKHKAAQELFIRKHSEIRFVRSRMFYAKPSINAKGNVRLGLRHIRKPLLRYRVVLAKVYRCLQQVFQSRQRTRDSPHHEIRVSATIPFTQRFHVQD